MKKTQPNPKANRAILFFAYVTVILFLGMAARLGYFLQKESEDVINNPYNARISNMETHTVRGKILAADGTVLAETRTAADGTESRYYAGGNTYAHVVGYSSAGKTGIESLANFYLLNSHQNVTEQIKNELTEQKNTGDNVVTTLDTTLQAIAYDALGSSRGAVIAMEPDTGKILAMVSKPDFDPNTVAANWNDLISGDSTEARLLNRATQGLYPPGSTFKIVTALEYMREHQGTYNEFHYNCGGVFENGSYTIQCYHKSAHGEQNFTEAFANSCNGAFASLGLTLNRTAFQNLAEQLLFNREQPLSLPYSKSTFHISDDTEDWEVSQTAIGQGETLMTPMHNLMLVSAIANGGILMTPYLIDRVETSGGDTVKKFMPQTGAELMVANEASALAGLLVEVVNEGTGSAVRSDAYQAAGKTGSAEFESGKETHAWFVGYAPADHPKIAVCVIVEEGGSGGRAAAPIAKRLFDAWLN